MYIKYEERLELREFKRWERLQERKPRGSVGRKIKTEIIMVKESAGRRRRGKVGAGQVQWKG
jgi:hypothetical protein